MSMASCQAAFQANMVYGHRPSPFDIDLIVYIPICHGYWVTFCKIFLFFVVILRVVVFSCIEPGVRELLALRMCKSIEDSS